MKQVFVLAMFSLFVNLASCQSTSSKNITTVAPAAFEQKLTTTGAQLIDVRSAEEYAGGHLNNAININVRADDFAEKVAKLDKTKPVMVYCHSGTRSAAAASKLDGMGFKEIYNLDGGITAWGDGGKPVVTNSK